MGNSRQFRAGRQARVASLKAQNRQLKAALGYQQGLTMAMAAELEASKMERPPDLDEWIESIVPDMDADERAAWDAMSEDERARFVDELGRRINQTKAAVAPTASWTE